MKLLAKKPCSFGGKKFYLGEEIPSELVLDPKAQEKMGVLLLVSDDEQGDPTPAPAAPEASTIGITIPVDEGELALEVSKEGLQAVFTILTAKTADAEPVIEQMTDGDALILLHLADNRKAVKAAAEARAKAINGESAGEQ